MIFILIITFLKSRTSLKSLQPLLCVCRNGNKIMKTVEILRLVAIESLHYIYEFPNFIETCLLWQHFLVKCKQVWTPGHGNYLWIMESSWPVLYMDVSLKLAIKKQPFVEKYSDISAIEKWGSWTSFVFLETLFVFWI